jgi:hypothetical protein
LRHVCAGAALSSLGVREQATNGGIEEKRHN